MDMVEIGGVKLRLTQPDELNFKWIGAEEALTQLLAAWTILNEDDIPLNPRILGKPGVGKTTLAYSAAKYFVSEKVFIFQCTMDTRPEDLIVQPVINEDNKIEYHASALVTAMIQGGICILDEGNRMSEKSWASLAPLLDKRRYVESIIAGIKIKAHKNFRIVVTMNTDSSTYEVPEYIDSRLQPKIFLDFPEARDEYEILKYSVPFSDENLLRYIVSFLQDSHKVDRPYSVRDGINIARYYLKLVNNKNLDELKQKIKNQKPSKKQKEKIAFDRFRFEQSLGQILDEEAIKFFNLYTMKKIRKFGLKDPDELDKIANMEGNDRTKYGDGFLSEFYNEEDDDDDEDFLDDEEDVFFDSDIEDDFGDIDNDFDDDFLEDEIDFDEDFISGEKPDDILGPVNEKFAKKYKEKFLTDVDEIEDENGRKKISLDDLFDYLEKVDNKKRVGKKKKTSKKEKEFVIYLDGEPEDDDTDLKKSVSDFRNMMKKKIQNNLENIEDQDTKVKKSKPKKSSKKATKKTGKKASKKVKKTSKKSSKASKGKKKTGSKK